MKYLKAFIAGLALPATALPLMLIITALAGKGYIVSIFAIHMLPLVWGLWNVLHAVGHKKKCPICGNPTVMGAILGLIVALYAVFVVRITFVLGINPLFTYCPVIMAPITYALLWHYVVKPLNKTFGVYK